MSYLRAWLLMLAAVFYFGQSFSADRLAPGVMWFLLGLACIGGGVWNLERAARRR